jgi:hypothetical protein
MPIADQLHYWPSHQSPPEAGLVGAARGAPKPSVKDARVRATATTAMAVERLPWEAISVSTVRPIRERCMPRQVSTMYLKLGTCSASPVA